MKLRLKRDLPECPAGTVFVEEGLIWEAENKSIVPDWLDVFVSFNHENPDWFERIDETPLYWEPEEGETFFYVDSDDGETCSAVYHPFVHKHLLEIGNAFPTKEAAQAHVEYLKALTRVRKWISEQGFEVLGEGEPGYDLISSGMISTSHKDNPVLPKLKSMNDAHQVIDNCQDDLKTIFGVES